MNWTITFSPLIPDPVLWAAIVVAAVLVFILILRRSRGALLRALALTALIAALANPAVRQEERESLNNIAIVIADESASQSLEQRTEATTLMREALEKQLKKIPKLDVKWVEGAKPSAGAPRGTALFQDLNTALKDTPPDRLAGVIVLTDGQVHDVPKAASELGFDAPVHALLTGQRNEFDRRIEVIKAPRYGIVGQTRTITLKIRQAPEQKTNSASLQDSFVNLRLKRQGEPDEVRQVQIDAPVDIEMAFPHAGTNIVEFELEAALGELTTANNRAVIAAEGVRENLRVLLVSGEPHAGERTWRNLLKSDAAVDLVHFTILRPPQKQDGTPINELSLIAFPTRELFSQKIQDFDLIIFDHYEYRGILRRLYFENISNYVAKLGGALLVAAGDDYSGRASLFRTPLSPVLPAVPTGEVIEQPFKAKVTTEGEKHPVTRDLPGSAKQSATGEPSWGRWFRQVDVRTNRGRTILNGAGDKPLLILDRKGEGRVALLTSDQAWLWARGFEGGGPHTDLLRRLSHWLMKEPDLEEERLLASARDLKLTLERYTMEDQVADVTLSGPDGKDRSVPLKPSGNGLFKATVNVKLPGLYKAETNAPSGTLRAVAHAGQDDPREMSNVVSTEMELKPLLTKTGGGAVWPRKAADGTSSQAALNASDLTLPRISMLSNAKVFSGSGWIALKDREAYVTRGVKVLPLFDGLIALALMLSLLALAWWREGR